MLPSHTRNQNSTSSATRVPPPPPPPAAPPAKASKPQAKVLYDFAGQKDNELTVKAGDIIEVVQKENNGMPTPFH
jgi:myosin-1